jgi:histidine ammonia-lyase
LNGVATIRRRKQRISPMPNDSVILDGTSLTIDDVVEVARNYARVEIAPTAVESVKSGRKSIERILKSGKTVYGINTGFGKLADTKISIGQLDQLQHNLIRSHSVGTGAPLDEDETRAVMVVRLASLLHGNSGVRLDVIRQLQEFLNRRVYPVIPRYGSLGASGDLAPSAHLALCLVGEGRVFDSNNRQVKTTKVLDRIHLAPLRLKAKEGLAIINGTQVMTGLGALLINDARSLIRNLDFAAAMSVESLGGSLSSFQSRIQKLRPMHGQAHVAARILRMLRDSELTESASHMQDPYSLRCIPQVHGAFYDALQYAKNVIEIELNSVTDNPIIFPESDEVVSAGNFHGQPVSLALDLLCMAVAEASLFSERRIDKLLSGYNPKLPLFLSGDPGLNSGFMVTQYTAAALVAENRILSRPASAENASVSAGQEDHASMGVTAALKAREVVEHATTVIAIEILCAAQALESLTRGNGRKMGQGTKIAFKEVRGISRTLKEDRSLEPDVSKLSDALKQDKLTRAIERTIQL